MGEPGHVSLSSDYSRCSWAASHDIVPTKASLDFKSPLIRESDARPMISQVHSSPSMRPAVASNNPLLTQAEHKPSPRDAITVAESSFAVYQLDTLPPPNNFLAETAQDLSPVTEPTEVFRFLDLASETRNRIYHFILGPPQDPSICLTEVLDTRLPSPQSRGVDFDTYFRTKAVKINPKHKDPNWGVTHQVKPSDLSILMVSKQIYAEAFHVFYTENCFSFTDTGLLYRFLKNIGYIRRQHLTMIYFLWRGPDAKEAFRLLKTCRRLKIVQFTVPCSHPPGYEALKEVRVEMAKARALIHFTPAQNPPLNIHDHTSCFGDYLCHCICRRPYEPASNIRELEKAMMRPRREQELPDPDEKFDLFKPKREHFKKSEDQDLLQEKASFEDFVARIEKQGKQLRYLGHRNKAKEAALHQTLRGADVDDYFRDFAEKLAKDKRRLKYYERWLAKKQEEDEAKEREELATRKYIEEKELAIRMRREARELERKTVREAREHAKKVAKEERELKRRLAREAKEREKMLAREENAQKKAAREANRLTKRTNAAQKKGSNESKEL